MSEPFRLQDLPSHLPGLLTLPPTIFDGDLLAPALTYLFHWHVYVTPGSPLLVHCSLCFVQSFPCWTSALATPRRTLLLSSRQLLKVSFNPGSPAVSMPPKPVLTFLLRHHYQLPLASFLPSFLHFPVWHSIQLPGWLQPTGCPARSTGLLFATNRDFLSMTALLTHRAITNKAPEPVQPPRTH
jgi:hypothetical protein